MTIDEVIKDSATHFFRRKEDATDVVVNALAYTFKMVTGKDASDKLRDELFQAVRFHL